MTQTLSDLSVTEAASKSLELIAYGEYLEAQKDKYSWSTPFVGTFEEYVNSQLADEIELDQDEEVGGDFDTDALWQHFKYEGSTESITRDGWSAKVEKSFGGEGQGDQYWMVISVSDGTTTRYFRKDGWYASYDGGTLDGETYEVTPKEKTIIIYE